MLYLVAVYEPSREPPWRNFIVEATDAADAKQQVVDEVGKKPAEDWEISPLAVKRDRPLEL